MTGATGSFRFVVVLSENWTMTSPRDLRALVRMAVEAEDAGIDGVMLSQHIALGPGAGADGRPDNPRDYAAPGNQDPNTPWPDSIVPMSAIAAVTTRLRLIGAAIIAPLRHPVLLAHQLATLDLLCEGRLLVQPTVSWNGARCGATRRRRTTGGTTGSRTSTSSRSPTAPTARRRGSAG
ncbi:MAG TPA: LLM class flavin-dependent oxidoreductase [Solirubrobacteraceae bacterium]|nr:LLM class flavin-dependent oxidoreductase [Solirubrobacteraceae bacterium]